jgi:prepilin-type N-terminal cleavage/methylation domain-containing protein
MKKISSQSGFTLVELLVSLAIFTIIVVAAVGSLYTVNQASKRVNAMRTVLDNLNFATESMSRTIRTATDLGCGTVGVDCPMGSSGTADQIVMNSTLGADNGTQIGYRFYQNGNNGEIQKCNLVNGGFSDNTCVSITAPEIDITKAQFFVKGSLTNDSIQPSVMIMIQGIANAAGSSGQPFAVQTLVSQRSAE